MVEGLGSEPVTDEEFKRAQAKWLKDWEQQYTNPETIGVALSETVAQGDWRLFFLLRDRVRALTRDDVQRVAQQRLAAVEPHAGHLRADRAAAARAGARAGRRGGADEDLQAAGVGSRGRGVRLDAGQHRRQDAALGTGQWHEGGAADQAHARADGAHLDGAARSATSAA